MNEQKNPDEQTFLQVNIILAIYSPKTVSVIGLLNANIVWGDR